MKTTEADQLLDRLARGDVGVASDLHTAYAAYLRTVVRRQLSDRLRVRFDSADVIQSVWVHVIRQLTTSGWQVASEAQLRALLTVIARRRLVSRARTVARSLAEENAGCAIQEIHAPDRQPRPSELAQAAELWERMLELCSPEHQGILRLRREGLPLAEIASRTGLHEGSVRRIIRRLARELALQVDPLTSDSDAPPQPGDAQ
jgi:RNA polymerase sigma-70 factor (ECF subfamily)